MRNEKNEVCGYILLEYGGNTSRYPWVSENDWVISPYVIKSELRGQGLGKRLLKDLKTYIAPMLEGNVYAEVRVNNTPSIKALESAGYHYLCNAKIQHGISRNYVVVKEPSDYRVYSMD